MKRSNKVLIKLLESLVNEPFEAQNLDCVAHLCSINHNVILQIPRDICDYAKEQGFTGKSTAYGRYFSSVVC